MSARSAGSRGGPTATPPKSLARHAGPSASPGRVRILCVDDHAVLIEGLRAQFALSDRIEFVGSLPSADGLLAAVTRQAPHVVLLDIEMPGPDVFEMADRVRQLHPQTRIVFLSAHIRDGYLRAAYKCGACGYFAKSDELEEIVAGVIAVATSVSGTFVLGPKVREYSTARTTMGVRLRRSNPRRPATRLDVLSPRELEVLRLIGKGQSRTQIAAELNRSAKTIDGHQKKIMQKLGVTARAELMHFAIREGLAEA